MGLGAQSSPPFISSLSRLQTAAENLHQIMTSCPNSGLNVELVNLHGGELTQESSAD